MAHQRAFHQEHLYSSYVGLSHTVQAIIKLVPYLIIAQLWCSGLIIKKIVPDHICLLDNISGSTEDAQEISQWGIYLNTYHMLRAKVK